MTDNTKLPENTPVFEAVVSFVPVERVLLRVAATSEEMALDAIKAMATEHVRDLTIESIHEVKQEDPIPSDFDEVPQEVATEKKSVH